ncbi:MAG: T9SS type A sorting domain-containing protein [Candidatus Zixiibacteriota bacterium]|nr:MAG: T9SS type A sorting domain-containing protein [candidate division Zixibacteria bacterium]
MTKRLQPILVVAMVLLVPTLVFAGANKFSVAKATAQDGNMVVSVHSSNAHPLAGLDIPLSYSEGVTLKAVEFNGTDVEYFQWKSAWQIPEERKVVIGLIAQFGPEAVPELKAGDNEICRLIFEVSDPAVTKITIDVFQMEGPNHDLTYIYHNDDGKVCGVRPEFQMVTLSLNGNDGVPTTWALAQNYPNPFNPKTKIAYDVPKAGHVCLKVYNVLGQTVATLVDGQKEAGSHTVEFDGRAYGSGVYFYRLETRDGFTETKKMVYLK